ncbi:dihydropteroate synthase [Malaciobacter mytili LMG 24559]|uniref:dihydropteroate synthase n=1 Tax=Malaciobacter mytili LMG 24559 TaxID=1032238 RepID=A0AAX2AKC5_9BACT|nr:dihydropteroate synthase [Malaciobacter mytili]AXH15046.1 dihydropteroate synthase [Malaciobacter mytili LMG 24559]RXK16729.1 dihydropteroate synthase [Malaciobacter mytili LMG 24559]
MQIYKISISDAKSLFEKLGCDKGGISILNNKSTLHTIYIKNLHVAAANILKQDALSIGADLAVPTGVIIAKDKYVNAILIASSKHLKLLSKKELAQPFGLKNLAKQLTSYILDKKYKTKIMGVLNANEDSFFKNSRFNEVEAISRIEKLIEDGADIIDIGAVSSRPGSLPVEPEIELSRVKNIADAIYSTKLYEKARFSIDSYEPLVIDYVLNKGFDIVNDITGLQNEEVIKLCAKYNATAVIMHMQKDPTFMQVNPVYEDVILEVEEFLEKQMLKAKEFGVKDIVLDVGIGFGKTLEHNLKLLNHLEHFKHLGCELLIGASRKSMIDKIVPSTIEQRLPGTLAIHLESIKKGASIIRCHDVKEHYQAIKVQEAILSQEIL